MTSLTTNGACNAVFPLTGSIKGYTNPFEKAAGIVWERTDQGVDAAMTPGSPLLAFAPSKVEFIVPDFYAGQPAIVFQITAGPLAGKWWYWSEQIEPTVSQGQTVAAGQVVATYAPSGTGIEIGWWETNGGYPLGTPGLQGRACYQRRRRLPLPAASTRRQPRLRRRPVQRHHDGKQLLPDRQPGTGTMTRRIEDPR